MNDNSATALLESPPEIEASFDRQNIHQVVVARLAEPSWIHRGQIPGLDGLRAIAVVMVLATKSVKTHGFPEGSVLRYISHQGFMGVDLFFVISGFLITTLLVRELDREGSVDLKRFYLRRFLRIMPAYFSLLVTVAVCQWIGYFQLKGSDWIGAATYMTNFLHHPSWELGHTWSLSVEEHFYLLWPFVLYSGGIAAGWRVALTCVVGCWLLRCGIACGLTTLLFPAGSDWADATMACSMAEWCTFTRLDTISMGCLLALGSRSENVRTWLNRATEPEMLWIYFITFCVSVTLMYSSKYQLCIAYTLNAACISLMMWGFIRSQGIACRILDNRVLKVIGIGSYSIYLWQQLFIHPRHAGWIHEFPQNIALTLGAAFLSFCLIEQPMNQLKDRVAG